MRVRIVDGGVGFVIGIVIVYIVVRVVNGHGLSDQWLTSTATTTTATTSSSASINMTVNGVMGM